jgi:uncharacterized protein (TIGR00299 family) protein
MSRPQDNRPPRHIHLDLLGGIAGDMFIAAVLDARPDLVAGTVAAIRAAGLPDDWVVEPQPGKDGGLVGTRMKIGPAEPQDAGHGHRHYRDIEASLAAAPLAAPVRDRALEILRLIAEAEAQVHGISLDEVVLHEVGALDSLADVVGAAFLIERLAPASWSTGPLPVGGGTIQSAHGRLPVPAPATQILLAGFPFVDDGIGGERITPTGAAILRHLRPGPRMPGGILEAAEVGQGFGTRSLPGVANMLRVRCYRPQDDARADTQVAVLEFLIDDQTPEDLAAGLEALRDRPGVLEVLAIPAAGKKGRLGQVIQVLATPESLERTTRACFEETTTIGLRRRLESRVVLSRREAIGPDGVAVKLVERPGGQVTAKAELDDLRAQAQGQPAREALRRRVEAADLTEDGDGRA